MTVRFFISRETMNKSKRGRGTKKTVESRFLSYPRLGRWGDSRYLTIWYSEARFEKWPIQATALPRWRKEMNGKIEWNESKWRFFTVACIRKRKIASMGCASNGGKRLLALQRYYALKCLWMKWFAYEPDIGNTHCAHTELTQLPSE